ncbi:hypothetical protein SAMN05660284_00656 [Formivibrio citricus]|uniref:Uncharacterized protein n=1 Tax=Formivibrio citricus TaxID=83765 RepID=A0A1I4WKU1_9NEIS|nr:hypothetical protein [Formivibrio citricus]SFN13893.1 hypothetical protein SAMN05660284_00656 [Formivibrio citricus]
MNLKTSVEPQRYEKHREKTSRSVLKWPRSMGERATMRKGLMPFTLRIFMRLRRRI